METLLAILSTASVTALITWASTKGKTKAETAKIVAETYGKMVDDLRSQMKFQGEQLNQQTIQITKMQERELEHMKMINRHDKEKKDLIALHHKEITELNAKHHKEKTELITSHQIAETELKAEILKLKNDLGNRMSQIENKLQ
jgi:hypothetical protein